MNRRSFLKAMASVPVVAGLPVAIAVATAIDPAAAMGGMPARPDFRGLQFHVIREEFGERDGDVYFVGLYEEQVPGSEIVVGDGRFIWTKDPDAEVLAAVMHTPGDGESIYGESAWMDLHSLELFHGMEFANG